MIIYFTVLDYMNEKYICKRIRKCMYVPELSQFNG